MRIVHISQTPLVGAPSKLSRIFRRLGHDAISICLSDYSRGGPLESKFISEYLIWGGPASFRIQNGIRFAQIIHIHNDLTPSIASAIWSLNQDAAYVYQAHSPLREGPLYADRSEELRLPFRLLLVVGQHWGRLYPGYLPIPNLILDPPSICERRDDEVLKVMLSPTHKQEGRWTSKFADGLVDTLTNLHSLGLIELHMPDKPVHPHELMEIRRICHVSIDEIATGGFHQVSLEGLCAGTVVVNRADWFSKAIYSQFCSGTPPPYMYATPSTIGKQLIELAHSPQETRRLQRVSYDFFVRHCQPEVQARVLESIYEKILSDS